MILELTIRLRNPCNNRNWGSSASKSIMALAALVKSGQMRAGNWGALEGPDGRHIGIWKVNERDRP